MTVNTFDELLAHQGHTIQCVTYGPKDLAPGNVAIECESCGTVLVDYERHRSSEIIRIIFTEDDVQSLLDEGLEDEDVVPSLEEALVVVNEWAKHIESTAVQLINEQLASVVTLGTP